MNNISPENSTPISPQRSDEIKKGLNIFARAIEHSEQLPKDFTLPTSFLVANVKSLHPSADPYNVSFREMREFMAKKVLEEESRLTN
jgi:hypothetical protein